MQRWKTGKTIYYTTMFVATVFFYSVTGFLIYVGITLSFAVLASVVALSYYQVDADTRCGEFSGGATCGSGTTMMEWAGMGPEGAAVQAWLVGGLGRMLAEYVVLVVVAFGVASRFGSGTPHQVPSRHTTLYAYVDFAYTTLGFAVVQVQLLFRVVLGLLMLLVYIPRVDCSVLVGDASAWDPGFKAYVPHAAGAARGLRVARWQGRRRCRAPGAGRRVWASGRARTGARRTGAPRSSFTAVRLCCTDRARPCAHSVAGVCWAIVCGSSSAATDANIGTAVTITAPARQVHRVPAL